MSERLLIYRRNMPHWRLPGSVYFTTWRLHSSQAKLTESERHIVASSIKHFDGQRYKLFAYVVMDDHCHALFRSLDGQSLQSILHSWKCFTANGMYKTTRNGTGQLWQREYFDRIVRDDDEFWEKLTYIMNNPAKRWPETTAYPWAEWFEFG